MIHDVKDILILLQRSRHDITVDEDNGNGRSKRVYGAVAEYIAKDYVPVCNK